jgi:hemerythrin
MAGAVSFDIKKNYLFLYAFPMELPYDWRPEYSVGNKTLDSQHQKLLQICKRVSVYRCDGTRTSISHFHTILNDLASYAATHFETEERVLHRIGYPSLLQQNIEHKEYSERLVDFLCAAIDGRIDREALEEFLWKWWVSHILESDMQYASYIGKP